MRIDRAAKIATATMSGEIFLESENAGMHESEE
jgi:hypothetical protein